MNRSHLLLLILVVAVAPSARSECMSTGYMIGSPVPHYSVVEKRSLLTYWNDYKIAYPESHRLSPVSKFLGIKDLSSQCLIRVKPLNRLDTLKIEQLIVQIPCDDLQVGRTLRLVPFSYCREYFDPKETPDFYDFLGFRLANVSTEKVFR